MTNISRITSESPTYHTIEKPTYWTKAKIQQVALAALAMIATISALALSILIPAPLAYLAIPLALGSFLLGYAAYKIKDYDNPEKLKLYREQALSMTFQELISEFGLKNVMQHKLLPLETTIEKFNRQVQGMDFSSVLKTYNMEELLTHRIATPEHVALLRNLESQAFVHRTQFDAEVKQIDLRHRGRSDVLKENVRQTKFVADTTAMMATQGDSKERIEAYGTANVITTPLAFVGEMVADHVGRDSQASYEKSMAYARVNYHSHMNRLEDQYTQFKRQLK